jgi:Uma2 family endonuclease
MTPTTETTTPAPAEPRRRKRGRCVLIHNVDWEMYEKLLDAFLGHRNARLAYDRGDLEIMAPPSYEHEGDGWVLGQMIYVLADECGLALIPGGSTTLKRSMKKRGIEPDKCFWLKETGELAGVKRLDLDLHPPPDLAVEVDVSPSSLNRFGIYAMLGVAEVWRIEGDDLRFHVRGPKKKFVEAAHSLAFPLIAPADLLPWLRKARATVNVLPVMRDFRAWVQQRVASQAPSAQQ